jgi:hypothetical protein
MHKNAAKNWPSTSKKSSVLLVLELINSFLKEDRISDFSGVTISPLLMMVCPFTILF